MSSVLPGGWSESSIGELGKYINGRGFKKSEWRSEGLPIIRIQNLNNPGAEYNYSDAKHEQKYAVSNGDLLISWAASLGVYLWRRGPAWLNQHIFRVEVDEQKVTKPYLYWALNNAIGELEKKAHGSGMVHITKDRFKSHPINLAPKHQQREIVSKIDELFSQIDEGERALKRVQTLVERYRQSVLKAAVTGELTRDWRAQQKKPPVETGEALLQRILKARRAAWEKAELEKMGAKGKTPANDAWRKKYKEPTPPDTAELPNLPEGWAWATLDQLCSLITSGSRGWKKYYADSGSLFIRAQDIKYDSLELTNTAFVDVDGVSEGSRTKVQTEDLLITITGANVTKSARIQIPIEEGYVSQHVALARPTLSFLSAFIFHWVVSPANGREKLLDAAYGAGKPGLSLTDLKELPVALPPSAEQAIICERLEANLEALKHISGETNKHLYAAQQLRQATLKSAFSGCLVPKNRTDKPAAPRPTRTHPTERAETETGIPESAGHNRTIYT